MNMLTKRLNRMDDAEVCNKLTRGESLYIEKQQVKLQTTWKFKSGLSSSLVSSIISEDEYQTLKAGYAVQISEIEESIELTSKQIRDIIAHKDERLMWFSEICHIAGTEAFDRATFVQLVKRPIAVSRDGADVEFVFLL